MPAPDAAARQERLRVLMMLALTFVAGTVDAMGFIRLDHVFAGTATGNVLILGMALAGGFGLPILGPAAALVTFFCGAVIAVTALRRAPRQWSRTITIVLLCNAALLAVLAIALAQFGDALSRPVQITASSTMALAMGAQAVVARRLAVSGVNTLVVTVSLVAWAEDSIARPSARMAWDRRIGAVLILALGAFCGALLLRVHQGLPLGLAAAVVLAVALIGHRRLLVDVPARAR